MCRNCYRLKPAVTVTMTVRMEKFAKRKCGDPPKQEDGKIGAYVQV